MREFITTWAPDWPAHKVGRLTRVSSSHWTLSTIDFCHSTLCASFSALPEWISFGLVAFSKLCFTVYESGSSKNQNQVFCARIWLDLSAVKKPWKTPLKSVIYARSCFNPNFLAGNLDPPKRGIAERFCHQKCPKTDPPPSSRFSNGVLKQRLRRHLPRGLYQCRGGEILKLTSLSDTCPIRAGVEASISVSEAGILKHQRCERYHNTVVINN